VLAGFSFISQGKYDTARTMVQQALDLDATSDLAQFQLGYIDLAAGYLGAAIVELEKARRTEAIPYMRVVSDTPTRGIRR